LPDDAIFLADAGFVLEPDFDRCCPWYIGQVRATRVRSFLNAAMNLNVLPGTMRARAHVREADFL